MDLLDGEAILGARGLVNSEELALSGFLLASLLSTLIQSAFVSVQWIVIGSDMLCSWQSSVEGPAG